MDILLSLILMILPVNDTCRDATFTCQTIPADYSPKNWEIIQRRGYKIPYLYFGEDSDDHKNFTLDVLPGDTITCWAAWDHETFTTTYTITDCQGLYTTYLPLVSSLE